MEDAEQVSVSVSVGERLEITIITGSTPHRGGWGWERSGYGLTERAPHTDGPTRHWLWETSLPGR